MIVSIASSDPFSPSHSKAVLSEIDPVAHTTVEVHKVDDAAKTGAKDEQAKPMRRVTGYIRRAGLTVLCIALLTWSVMQPMSHKPAVLTTIQDHLEMIADHGHSHGFEEDLYWALHGHSHDVADHDHNQVFLMAQFRSEPHQGFPDLWWLHPDSSRSFRKFRFERPPRA